MKCYDIWLKGIPTCVAKVFFFTVKVSEATGLLSLICKGTIKSLFTPLLIPLNKKKEDEGNRVHCSLLRKLPFFCIYYMSTSWVYCPANSFDAAYKLMFLSKISTPFYKWSQERYIRLNIDLTVNLSFLTFVQRIRASG